MADQAGEPPMQHCPPIETHLLASRHVAQTFKIQVYQPTQARNNASRFPVVYVTDGNRVFDLFKCVSEILQVTGYDSPRFILVGIGYPSDCPRAGSVLRARDFTFPGYPTFRPEPPPVEGVLAVEPGTKTIHGAAEFRDFIEHELIPFIDGAYATASGDNTLFGHSGGGGFGLFTLFTRPDLFKRYVVSSPNLAFHGEFDGVFHDHFDYLFEYARAFVATGPRLKDAHLYLSVGEAEEFEPGLEGAQLTSTFFRMAQLLRAAAVPGLALETELFPRETHMSVWPMAFTHGLQSVFEHGFSRTRKARDAG